MTTEETNLLEDALMVRRLLINLAAGPRELLEQRWGQVWDTDELRRDFEVRGFEAPFVVVIRRFDGKLGSLMFQHHPRFYWGWEAYDGPPLSSLRDENPAANNLPDEPAEKEKGTNDERQLNQHTQQDQPVDLPVVWPSATDQGTEGGEPGT